MKESLNKYFAGELTSDEKESFLMEVDKDIILSIDVLYKDIEYIQF